MTDPGDEHRPTDIVSRLRLLSNGLTPRTESDLMREAATEIARLEALNAWTTNLLAQQSERCAALAKEVSRLRALMPARIERILYEGEG